MARRPRLRQGRRPSLPNQKDLRLPASTFSQEKLLPSANDSRAWWVAICATNPPSLLRCQKLVICNCGKSWRTPNIQLPWFTGSVTQSERPKLCLSPAASVESEDVTRMQQPGFMNLRYWGGVPPKSKGCPLNWVSVHVGTEGRLVCPPLACPHQALSICRKPWTGPGEDPIRCQVQYQGTHDHRIQTFSESGSGPLSLKSNASQCGQSSVVQQESLHVGRKKRKKLSGFAGSAGQKPG